jgi:hypothetical protein
MGPTPTSLGTHRRGRIELNFCKACILSLFLFLWYTKLNMWLGSLNIWWPHYKYKTMISGPSTLILRVFIQIICLHHKSGFYFQKWLYIVVFFIIKQATLWFPKDKKKKHIRKFKKRLFGFIGVNIAYQTTLFCWSMWTNLTPIPSLSTSISQDLSIDFRM